MSRSRSFPSFTMTKFCLLLQALVCLTSIIGLPTPADAFVEPRLQTPTSSSVDTRIIGGAGISSRGTNKKTTTTTTTVSKLSAHSAHYQEDVNFLLREFVFYDGQVLDPYKILKVPRQAERRDIKEAYRRQSRLYHPDAARHRDILPGSCNNEQEVRDQWERINWSYDLLSDPVRRRKFDRHDFLADPAKAMRRAAAKAAWAGVTTVGKGLWTVGSTAVSTAVHHIVEKSKEAAAAAAATTTSDLVAIRQPPPVVPNGVVYTIVEYKTYAGYRSFFKKEFCPWLWQNV